VSDNVFDLDAHRRKKATRPVTPRTLQAVIVAAERAVAIDHATWLQHVELDGEPSLVVRTTAANVLTEFRVHPKSRIVGQQDVRIELLHGLLAKEEMTPNDFVKRSARLISRLLDRKVDVLRESDAARIWLVYTTTSPRPA
jgi:hypothetical protein